MPKRLLSRLYQASLVVLCSASLVGATEAPPTATVHIYQSPESGIFSNAYLIETGHHVVAIDTTLLQSTSKELRNKLLALGKPLSAVLITHGHPDHYNGITNLLAGENLDVYATAGTDKVIRENDAAKEKLWVPMFGAEWPKHRTFPNRIVASGESMEVDGVTFTVHNLGPGESHSDSYWVVKAGAQTFAFIGDVVLDHVHAYVNDGHTTDWLKNIDQLKSELKGASMLYPGHGNPGGAELLDWQRGYLTAYRTEVIKLAAGRPTLTDDQKKALVIAMEAYFPSKKLEFLIALGADSVAAELSKESK